MAAFDETAVRRAGDGTFAANPSAAEADVSLDAPGPDVRPAGLEDRVASVRFCDVRLAILHEQVAVIEQERARHALAELALRHPSAASVYVSGGLRRTVESVSEHAGVRGDRESADGWQVDAPSAPGDPWRGFYADTDDGDDTRVRRELDLDKVRAWSAATAQVGQDTAPRGGRPTSIFKESLMHPDRHIDDDRSRPPGSGTDR